MLNLDTINQNLQTIQYMLLKNAILESDEETVMGLLQADIDVHRVDEDGRTLLHDAAQMDSYEAAKAMLDRGADVNKQDNHGVSPLHLAARKGHARIVSMLLAHHADVDVRDGTAQTPLIEAAANGREEVAWLLVLARADLMAVDQMGYTPLRSALTFGHVSTASVLLRYHKGLVDFSVHPRVIPLITAFNRCWERPSTQGLLLSAHNKWFYALEHMLFRVRNKAVHKALLEEALKRYPNDSFDSVLSLIAFFFIKNQGVGNIKDDYLEQWFNRTKSDPLLRKYVEHLLGLIQKPQRISQRLKNDLVDEALVWGCDRFLGQLLRFGGRTKHKASLKDRILRDTDGGLATARIDQFPSQFGVTPYFSAGIFSQVKRFLNAKDLYVLALTSKQLADTCSPEKLLASMVLQDEGASCEPQAVAPLGGGAKTS